MGGLFHTARRLQNDEYGFDTMGVDPFGRIVMRKYPPTDPNPTLDLYDFMRGGELEPHAWITPPHYDYLFNWMVPGFAPDATEAGPADAADIRSAEEFLVARGGVRRDGGGSFYPFYRIPATPNARRSASRAPTSGNRELRLLDEQGNVVRSVAWTPDFRADDSEEELEARSFTFILPPDPAVRRVELRGEDRVLDSFEVAPSLPRAADLEMAVQKEAGKASLRWSAETARDAGPRVLVHQVYYSRDNGRTWILARSGLPVPAADVDLRKLPGGSQCLFRVSTSDGYFATTLVSTAFSVDDKAPRGSIVAPRSGLVRAVDGGVLLIGRGFDLEDGAIRGENLTWISDLQGRIGTGEKLVVRNLKVGRHSITLESRDSAGRKGVSEPIVVTIRKR
jgi:hypothetical protein